MKASAARVRCPLPQSSARTLPGTLRWTRAVPLPTLKDVAFRDRLFATIRAARPVLEVPGVLVVGSEVPNLFEPDAASTLVVSQDLDVGVPVSHHAAVKEQLDALREFDASAAGCGRNCVTSSGPTSRSCRCSRPGPACRIPRRAGPR
jgi:hypothetical protein